MSVDICCKIINGSLWMTLILVGKSSLITHFVHFQYVSKFVVCVFFFKTFILKSLVTTVKVLLEMHSTKYFVSDLIFIVYFYITDSGIYDEEICKSLSNRRCIQRQLIIIRLRSDGNILFTTVWPSGTSCFTRGLYDSHTFCLQSWVLFIS